LYQTLRRRKMIVHQGLNKRGITLIEILVALVVFGFASAGIYRMFIGQSRAYAVQEQVVEVQQDLRAAAVLLTRDLRMAGYKNDNTSVAVSRPIFPGKYDLTVANNAVRIEYEHEGEPGNPNTLYTIVYYFNAGQVVREFYINNVLNASDVLLEDVAALIFNYGLDAEDSGQYDGAVDRWVSAGSVNDGRVISIQFILAAIPDPINPDLEKLSPRTLTTQVALRNPMVRHIRERI
jgi:prepilin-type N-terminal cleavage/methylation domain-containing protein